MTNRKQRRRAEALARKAQAAGRPAKPQATAGRAGPSLRGALLGTAAAGALLISAPAGVRAQTVVPPSSGPCVVVGTIATCTGDVSTGVYASSPLTILNVNSLTQAIAPALGDAGIEFGLAGGGNISINADTGPFGITATGNFAEGIYAYIYGSGNINVTSTGDIATTGAGGAEGISAGVRYGGDGNINITSTGNITTAGSSAEGIYAFIYGNGDINVTSTGNITTTGGGAEAIFAAGGGDGNINLTSTGNITTTGNYSDGIYASVYGDGNINVTSTGNISTLGNGSEGIHAYGSGAITITSNGNITTAGAGTDGIHVNSGGGTVTINQTGDITVTGDHSDAIYINNAAGAGNSTVTIAVGSTIIGGPLDGDGISFQDGNINRVFNYGTITTAGDNAIQGQGSGREQVFNFGTIVGNVDLGPGNDLVDLDTLGTTTLATFDGGADTDTFRLSGAGTNTLPGAKHSNFEIFEKTDSGIWTLTGTHHFATSATIFGGTLDLNGTLVSPTLSNQAMLAVGGIGTIGAGTLTGNLTQTGTGTFTVDVDFAAATSDLLTVSGTADLSGTVAANLLNLGLGTTQVTILTAAGGVTDNGLTVVTQPASPLITAQLLFPNPTDVDLAITVSFTPGGLNRNQTGIAGNLSAIMTAGGGLGGIINTLLFGISSLDQYRSALDQLSPEIYLNTETASLFAAEGFANNFFSCRVAGSGYAFIKEGECIWVRPEGRFLKRGRSSDAIGFKEDVGAFSAGLQVALAPGWYGGIGVGYETAALKTDAGARSDSDRFQVGGSLKFQSGPFLLAGAVIGGIGTYDTTRRMSFGGFSATAKSDHDITYVGGQVRAAYLVAAGNWYAKPLVDLNLTYLNRDGIVETGGGAANLSVAGAGNAFFSATPAVEFGAQYTLADGTLLQPYAKLGVRFYADDKHALSTNFSAAPAGIGSFAVSSEFDQTFADIEAGLTFMGVSGKSKLTLGYEGYLSDNTQQHGFVLKGMVKY